MITIVSGIPRSGTALMMQMLEAGGIPLLTDALLVGEAVTPHRYDALEAAQRLPDDTRWLASAEGKACKLLPASLPHLPASREYRVIFMLRDPDEILASQAGMRIGPADESQPPPDVMRRQLEDHVRRIQRWLDGPRRIATLYCYYDEAVSEPMSTARQLEAFLGMRLNLTAMAAVADPRLHHHRVKSEPPAHRLDPEISRDYDSHPTNPRSPS